MKIRLRFPPLSQLSRGSLDNSVSTGLMIWIAMLTSFGDGRRFSCYILGFIGLNRSICKQCFQCLHSLKNTQLIFEVQIYFL